MRGAGTPDDGINSVILDLARVTRVQKGGKRLRFRICVGIGDKKGKVGIALAKGADVQIAVEKATRKAKKDAITDSKTTPCSRIKYFFPGLSSSFADSARAMPAKRVARPLPAFPITEKCSKRSASLIPNGTTPSRKAVFPM